MWQVLTWGSQSSSTYEAVQCCASAGGFQFATLLQMIILVSEILSLLWEPFPCVNWRLLLYYGKQNQARDLDRMRNSRLWVWAGCMSVRLRWASWGKSSVFVVYSWYFMCCFRNWHPLEESATLSLPRAPGPMCLPTTLNHWWVKCFPSVAVKTYWPCTVISR